MLKTLLIQAIDAPGALAFVGHEPRPFQHPEVLRDGGPADRDGPGDLADRQGAIQEQPGQDRPSGSIAEGVELGMFVSIH
jgi:hypothetical protein